MAESKALNSKPTLRQEIPTPPKRNPGWCLGELPEGKTAQDMSVAERQQSAAVHEAKWKRRYGQAGVVENPWTRGHGG